MKIHISTEEAERFAESGWLLKTGVLDSHLIEELHQRFDALFHGTFATGVTPDEVNWQFGKSDPSLTRQICNAWKADRSIARVVLDESLGGAVAQLTGWPGVRIFQDNVLWKPRGARSIGFHQDNAYIRWLKPREMISCWMPLDDTYTDGGTMEVVPGSHRWTPMEPSGAFHAPDDYRAPLNAAAAVNGVHAETVPVLATQGSISFHHGWLWHGSNHNQSDHDRRVLVLHAISSEAEFVPAYLHEGVGPIYGRYRRLTDNRLDENFFPVLWHGQQGRSPGLAAYLAS